MGLYELHDLILGRRAHMLVIILQFPSVFAVLPTRLLALFN
jgi:hypothetical protein